MSFAPPLLAEASEESPIRWQGPPSCPRRAQFDSQLERLLSRRSAGLGRSVAQVRVVERGLDGFALHVTIVAPYGRSERDLTVSTCAQAQHAAALLIAAAVDLDEESSDETLYQESESEILLRAGALADGGSLPAVTVGPTIGVLFSGASVRGWVDARYFVPRRARDRDSSLVADLDLFVGALGIARLWKVGALALGPCVELEVGALRARATGELDARSGATLWLGSSAGVMVSHPRSARRVADLGLSLLMSVPWLRQPFALGTEMPFYVTSTFGFRAAIWLAFDMDSKS
jgi:hypothetical protein